MTITLAAGSATPLWMYEIVVEAPEAQTRPAVVIAATSTPPEH